MAVKPSFPVIRLSTRSACGTVSSIAAVSILLAGCANEGVSGPETVTAQSTTQVTEDTDAKAHDPGASVVATTGKPGDKIALAPLTKALVTPSAEAFREVGTRTRARPRSSSVTFVPQSTRGSTGWSLSFRGTRRSSRKL